MHIKDDSKVPSLKEESKMVRNRKVRKRERSGDKRKSVNMNTMMYPHFAKYKSECSQIPNPPCWRKNSIL